MVPSLQVGAAGPQGDKPHMWRHSVLKSTARCAVRSRSGGPLVGSWLPPAIALGLVVNG